MFSVGKMKVAGLVAGIIPAFAPAVASAHPHVSIDVGIAGPPVYAAECPPLRPPPCPAPLFVESIPVERVWIEPVYRTTCDRVWRDAITEDRCSRVWVPDCYRDEFVGHGRHQYVEHVLIAPGHYEDRHDLVVVQPGHWEDVQRQELVAPGHWENRPAEFRRVVEVAPPEPRHDFGGFFGRFRF